MHFFSGPAGQSATHQGPPARRICRGEAPAQGEHCVLYAFHEIRVAEGFLRKKGCAHFTKT
jgi:hypothetical protein